MECWRCGVEFDASEFIKSAPCEDCQLDFPQSWVRIDVAKAREEERIAEWIRHWYDQRYSDSEIAEAIGMTRPQVVGWRKKLDLPGHKFMGDEKWRDQEKVRADLAKRMEGNTYRTGKKANIAGIKAQRNL